MIAAAIVLTILLLIALLRIGVIAEYGAVSPNQNADKTKAELTAQASIGPVIIQLYPPKQAKNEEKAEKKVQTEKKAKEGVKKAGRLEELKNHVPAIKTLLSRLRRKLCINELTIFYMPAGDDPAATALWFGGVHIGYGFLVTLLENHFKIKKRDFRASVDFTMTEPYIYVRARISLAVWEAVYVAWSLAGSILRRDKMSAKIRKAV